MAGLCEPYTQWVLQDAFTAGRPSYADAGATSQGPKSFSDRAAQGRTMAPYAGTMA